VSITDLLNTNFVRWMDAEKTPESDIVISNRVRLARNLRMMPFSHMLNAKTGDKCIREIKDAWEKSKCKDLKKMNIILFDQIPFLDRQILVEKHLISPKHAESDSSYRGVLVNEDGSLAIMLNEEDHLRIQCFLPGLQMEECYKRAQKIDDALENNLDFAFDEKRGYLTSCPTNVGTGMRASVMLHLPAIAITGQTNHIFQNINQLGMTIRGLYGEGTEFIGNFFQLSNQVTLGLTEEDITDNLTSITKQVVEQERVIRERLKVQMKYQVEDRIGRAYGILTNAGLITSNEAFSLLSDVRLGVDLGIIKNIKTFMLNELIVTIRPAHLQKRDGKEMDAVNRDVKRAEVIKEKLLAGSKG